MIDLIARMMRRRSIRRTVARIRSMTLGGIMTKQVITIRPDATVVQAATKMTAEAVSCLVVMDEGRLAGIVSERDFVMKVPLEKHALSMRVRDIMTAKVVTATPSMTLIEAVDLMKSKGFRRLVVFDHGRLFGIVTQTDLANALRDAFGSYPVASEFTLSAIMSARILTATPKETFEHGCAKMRKSNIGCMIIAKDGEPLGIFTESDVVTQFYDHQGRLEIKGISDYMHKYVRAGEPSMNIFEANRLMLEKKMRRLLVVEDAKIIGVVTQTDIVRFVYPALDRILSSSEEPGVVLRSFPRHVDFQGEFRGEHLKVYRL